MPPAGLLDDPTAPLAFVPAPEVLDWLAANILEEAGALYNPDHGHLHHADLRILWASGPSRSKGRAVVGFAEEVAFRCSLWQKARQEQQMTQWFGYVPDWLITLDASYAAQCDDVAFCALVEHELYHIGQVQGEFGPEFKKDGTPKIALVGHDVEEFVGVVKRYGVGMPQGSLSRLVEAGKRAPEVSRAAINGACGTCLRLVA